MSDLVRFGVAMDRALLSQFDERISARGYENRSEALRDLVRADLTRAAWEGGAYVAGTLTLVYARKQRPDVAKVIDAADARSIVTSTHVTLDDTRCLEVLVLRGRAAQLSDLAGRLGGARGVLASELNIACVDSPRGPGAAADQPGSRGGS